MREKDDTVKSEQLCLFKLNCWWCVQFTMIFPLSGPKPKEQDLFKSSMPSKLFEEKCKITPAPPVKHSLVLSSFSLYCRQKERKRWVKGLITFFPQVSSVVFLFSWSPVHCAQLHTFLSLDYSILSVAQVIFCACCSGKTTCILGAVAFSYITVHMIHSFYDCLLCAC